jgi:Flp pilus assembly protein TadG
VTRRPRRCHGDEGNALVEFVYLSILLMIPLFYALLAVLQIQGAAFAVTEASRQAGRAYVRADTDEDGRTRAAKAVQLALQDQGIHDAGVVPTFDCGATACDLSSGQRVETTVHYVVSLPFVGSFFGKGRAGIPVTGTHVEYVDRFKEDAAK